MRVARNPARPWSSNARSQERSSSSDNWETRQASSIVRRPRRTAATTAALRRTTHLLVFGGGRSCMSSALLSDSSEAFPLGSARIPRSALVSATPAGTRSSRQIAAFRALLFYRAGFFNAGPIPIPLTIFSRFHACRHQFFHFLRVSQVRLAGCQGVDESGIEPFSAGEWG